MYGEKIAFSDIEKVEIVDLIPKIEYKKNGYSTGNIKKGYFKTQNGEDIKLIINKPEPLYIFIETTQGGKLYFNTTLETEENLLKQIKAKCDID